jgi:hypothetical protein
MVMSCLGLLLSGMAFFNSGCLVVNCERHSKPIGPHESVHYATTEQSWKKAFRRYFNSNDFNLNVAAINTEDRMDIYCWFYVIPVPHFWKATDHDRSVLTVQIQIEPKKETVLFEPSRIFYSGTNLLNVGPERIYKSSEHPITSTTVPITKLTLFTLKYKVNSNPDIPFYLSIEGCSVAGREVSLPRIRFTPVTTITPSLQLPY